jgi:site-specific DNA-methyltransferase (adenine-specific)
MKIHNGNNIDILKTYPDNYFDSIVTDPPYGIEFLAKEWDSNTGAVETWEQCYRVLKPGGYILAFSAARTYHNLATNIEGVGFEIRDQIMWLYASGFPKAQDIGKAIDKRMNKGQDQTIRAEYNGGKHGPKSVDLSMQGTRCPVCKRDSNARYSCDKGQECGMVYKAQTPEAQQWAGWKTALKPAHEPIVMARKPFKGSTIDNVLTHGVGALNIDATRIGEEQITSIHKEYGSSHFYNIKNSNIPARNGEETNTGRFPSNVLGEVSDYQKFFYCPKVSRAERHIGFEAPPDPLANYSQGDVKNHPLWDPSIGTNLQRLKHKILEHNKDLGKSKETILQIGSTHPDDIKKHPLWDPSIGGDAQRLKAKILEHTPKELQGNNHPTVKPVELMKYLVKLVTPAGGKVLDPFTGSGSTGMAAVELDYDFTGCELDPAYVNIATQRITAWKAKTDLDNNPLPEQWFTTGE